MKKRETKRRVDGRVELLSTEEMRGKYGLHAGNRPAITLRSARIPASLRALIPLAEKFGISDDLIREDVAAKAPEAELKRLKRAVGEMDRALDAWLAGPESEGPTYTPEYNAFSAMRMEADRV